MRNMYSAYEKSNQRAPHVRTVGKTTHARDIYNTCLKIKLPKRKSVGCVLDVALKRPGYGVPGDNA
jgi:hypothetical protein